jgi:hypothetical protein
LDGCHGCDIVRVDLVIASLAVVAIQCDVALWLVLVPWGPMVTGKVKGGGGEQFELLLIIIDGLEEPSNLVWL